jgi:hypothetical protein
MPAIRVVDEHLASPVLVYSGSGGVFENEKVLKTGMGIKLEEQSGALEIQADIDFITAETSKRYVNEIVFNDRPVGTRDGINRFFTVSSDPTDSGTVQLWMNGQLLTQDSDFSVSGRVIQFLCEPPIENDVILASYSRSILLKRYAFCERILLDQQTMTATLRNEPSSSQDLMLFLNGQLLTRGAGPYDNDYTLNGRVILLPREITVIDVVQATYSYI